MPLLNGEVGYRKEFATNREYSFIYAGIQHLARVNGVIGGSGKKFYYHNDHLGSALAVTDEKGNKVVERDFTPFGERINTDVYDDELRDLDEDESGFTGKDWDVDVELYYYNARWYDPEVGRFISEDSVADDPTLYVYGANNPIINIDPTGHFNISVARGTALISASINALSAIDPKAGKALNAFNTLLSVCNAIKYVEDFYLNHVVKNYTKASSWSSKTDIPGVSFSETSTNTVVDGKSQSTTLNQKFENKDKNISIEITTTTTADGKITQYYTITKPDGTTKTRDITYGEDGIADIIGVEGFTSDPTFGAIMIATTQKDGAVFALAGSTLPNDQSKFATIVDTDTFGRPYRMTYTMHKDLPALALEGKGKIDTLYDNPNEESDYFGQKYANGVLIHYGWHNAWRGSQGCQTIKPGSDVARNNNNFKGYHDYMDFIKNITSGRTNEGAFIGYYYLETIVSRMPSTTTN